MRRDESKRETVSGKWWSFEQRILRLSAARGRRLALLLLGLNLSAVPAAAQPIEDVGEAMCGTGIGELVALVLAGISMYLVVKAGIRGTLAFDKMGGSRSETQFEGKKQLAGAGKTLAGAFVPVAFGGVLEVVGMNTVSCISFDIGLVGAAIFV